MKYPLIRVEARPTVNGSLGRLDLYNVTMTGASLYASFNDFSRCRMQPLGLG